MFRKLVYLISFALVLSFFSCASADLVAYWPLNGDATDMAGNHHGTLVGGASFVSDTSRRMVLSVDGVNGHVEVPHDDDMVFSSADSYTIMAWVYLEALPGSWQTVMAKSRDQGSHYGIWVTDSGEWMGGGWENRGSRATTQVWVHIAYVQDADAGTGTTYIDGTVDWSGGPRDGTGAGDFWIGGAGSVTEFLRGMIDEVRVYNHVLTEEEIQIVMLTGAEGYPSASRPNPQDGAFHADTWVTLSWRPGDYAVTHDVYLGDNFDDVNDGAGDTFRGNQADTMLIAGFAGFAFPDGLVPGTTYYWRIDEVNDADPNSPWKGDVWSFWIPPKKAYEAVPVDGAQFIRTDVTLEWTGGFNAKLHTVYFGDDFDTVDNATGGAAQATTTFAPGALEIAKTYYWRVDEFDPPATHKGDIWSFTTLPYIPISDPDLVAWWKLDEGGGTTVVDWSGHGNHGTFDGDPARTDGYEAGALDLAGTGDYVDFADTSDLPAGTSARTMCGWGKTDTIAGGWRWIAAYGTGATSQAMFIGMNGDDLYGGGYGDDVLLSNFWQVGVWHHICLTYDGTTAMLYADGIQVASENKTWDLALSRAHIGRQVNNAAEFWNGLVDDVRIYDKALTAEEIRQVMLGNTKLAGSPVPDRDALVDIRDISSLSWSAGDTAVSHDVYFGTVLDTVAGADNNMPEFQGNRPGTSLSLAGLVEFGGGDYYWRINEVEADGTVNAGTIWKFTVPDYLIVDNFESYDNIDPAPGEPGINRIFDKWIDGFGTLTNGALVGNDLPPYAERTIVHGGAQSMIYRYDNAGKTSEATLTVAKRDWTAEGVTKLSLWLRGASANAANRIYVALNGTAVVYHDDPAATQLSSWTEWVIDLSAFGVGLTNVNSITIGIGTKGSPAAGGAGTMYFDDIRLVR